MKNILVIPGDGIGPEVILPTIEILSEITDNLNFQVKEAGKNSFDKTGESISDELLDSARDSDAILFGATTTSWENRYRSPILTLRQELDLFANVRPIKNFLDDEKKVDIVIIRENTEGLYTQNEEEDSEGVTTFRRISNKGCQRIVDFAFSWCHEHSRRSIVCVHKANVLKKSDGMFLQIFEEEAKKHRDMKTSEMLVDAMAMNIVMKPEKIDTIVTLNLYGDILSDLAAGLVGGLGFVPSANFGLERALFEPAHGSAPDIAQKGIANPFASLLSGAMMLEYLGHNEEARELNISIEKAILSSRNIIDSEGRCNTEKAISQVRHWLKTYN